MNSVQQKKFGFRLRTRSGAVVEKVLIGSDTEKGAQEKLFQMYPRCEILSSWQESAGGPLTVPSFEGVADLIARAPLD